MILLSLCNHKGGSGKTTSVLHFAAAMGSNGHRVLVVDLDPQAFLSRMLGVKEPAKEASVLALFGPEPEHSPYGAHCDAAFRFFTLFDGHDQRDAPPQPPHRRILGKGKFA